MGNYIVNKKIQFGSLLDVGSKMCLNPEIMSVVFQDPSFKIWLRNQDLDAYKRVMKILAVESDKEVALFKASFVLNPYHGFVYGGKAYEDLSSIGKAILIDAPQIDSTLFGLFKNQMVLWFMKEKGENITRKDLFDKVTTLSTASPYSEEVSFFVLGHLLTQDTGFYFEGKRFATIKEFFNSIKSDYDLLSKYDFPTMPSVKAWYIANRALDKLHFVSSLLDTNEQEIKKCKQVLKMK